MSSFSFEPSDKCLYNGKEIDNITGNVTQRFVVHFGDTALNDRFYVELSEDKISFFFYDNEPDTGRALNVDDLKELGCVSLAGPKDTGNSILRFPQTIGVNNKPQIGDDKKKVYQDQFYSFPFWNFDDSFKALVKCCLLMFVSAIEADESEFDQSPLYAQIKEKLQLSEVYKLLSAKVQYTLGLTKGGLAYDATDYSYKVGKYADRLMDKRINKVISPRDYPSKNKKKTSQSWFNHPEMELEDLLKQNRRQDHSCNKKPTLLDDSLVLKIRDFLYTKHAVYQAMTRTIGKRFFLFGQILMAITTLSILSAFLQPSWFETAMKKVFPNLVFLFCLSYLIYFGVCDWKNKKKEKKISSSNTKYRFRWQQLLMVLPALVLMLFLVFIWCLHKNYCIRWGLHNDYCESWFLHDWNYYLWFFVAVVVSVLAAIFFSGWFNNASNYGLNGVSCASFPRILVAELAAWLTIGIAEDLVKSMLWVRDMISVLVAVFAVLVLIALIIGGEVKQHSPYLSNRHIIFKRILPILNHSMFFALLIGGLTQLFFYQNLIKNSDVMSSVVFSNYFAKADYYSQTLEDLDKAMSQYENYYRISSMKETLSGKGSVKQFYMVNDSSRFEAKLSLDLLKSKFSSVNSTNHNNLARHVNTIMEELRSLHLENNINPSFLYKDSLNNENRQLLESLLPLAYAHTQLNGYWLLMRKTQVDTISRDSTIISRYMVFLNRKDEVFYNSSLRQLGNEMGDSEKKTIMDYNIQLLGSLPYPLQKEITSVRRSLVRFNDYDTLMSWATAGTANHANTGSHYLDRLTADAMSIHECSRKIHLVADKDNKTGIIWRIFPILLIFHTLIVLVLAFVTQLIISDKSVTEPI